MIRVTVSDPNTEGQRFDRADDQAQHRQLLLYRLSAHSREIMADVGQYTDIAPAILISGMAP